MTDESSKGAASRPRRRRKEARPGEIVDAGLQLFAEAGFAAARLEDVARRAGVAKGTIYRYFDSKEALFEAAVRSRIGPVFAEIDRIVDDYGGDTPSLLRLMLRALYAQIVEGEARTLLRILVSEGARFPALTAFYHAEVIAQGVRFLERVVSRGVRRGEFRAGAAADLPMVIVAPAMMAVLWKLLFERHQPMETERFLAAHVDLVLNGLLAPERV